MINCSQYTIAFPPLKLFTVRGELSDKARESIKPQHLNLLPQKYLPQGHFFI